MYRTFVLIPALLGLAMTGSARAEAIDSKTDPAKPAEFDITRATASTDGRLTSFALEVAGTAGASKPEATGKLHGSKVYAYVWPTKLDPGSVGFAPASGILALAITAHPDFDDTPLYDENGDGKRDNDGGVWHAHWVVLAEDAACAGGLKVRDVASGAEPQPTTAPGLPLALDSPAERPVIEGKKVRITLPVAGAGDVAFDAVTAELQVDPQGKTPLLCVVGVRDVASGDLSLPGRIEHVN